MILQQKTTLWVVFWITTKTILFLKIITQIKIAQQAMVMIGTHHRNFYGADGGPYTQR